MRETAINWIDEENEITISTSESYIKARLDKLCKDYPEHYKFKSESGDYKNYIVFDKKLIKFRKPIILSEEQKEEIIKRFKKD
jgi:hypothetical protein